MKYKELPKRFKEIALKWIIDEFNLIEKENESTYRYDYNKKEDKTAINEILDDRTYEIEYSKEYPHGILRYE